VVVVLLLDKRGLELGWDRTFIWGRGLDFFFSFSLSLFFLFFISFFFAVWVSVLVLEVKIAGLAFGSHEYWHGFFGLFGVGTGQEDSLRFWNGGMAWIRS
jgi:hypothetical protein